MLTFKHYLIEKWGRGFDRVEYDSHGSWATRKNTVHHKANVKGHNVSVMFYRNHNDEHDLDFHVNHSWTDGSAGEAGPHILNHVHKVISYYIKKKKPTVIKMIGNTEQKQSLYDKYGEHLAKKHGGVYDKYFSVVLLGKK